MRLHIPVLILTTAAGGLTACGGGSGGRTATSASAGASTPVSTTTPAPTADASAALKTAVNAYSVAYLSGDGPRAFALLSARCKARISAEQMQSMTTAAKNTYGEQPIKQLTVDTQAGDLARVTYTYSVPAINQTKEPWVREGGKWLEDDC